MKRICPVCGKKRRMAVKSYRPRKNTYKRQTSYKCSYCGNMLANNKNRPSAAEHAIVFLTALTVGAALYFMLPVLLSEMRHWELLIEGILILTVCIGLEYQLLGIVNAYFPTAVFPADQNGTAVIKKPDIVMAFKDGSSVPKRFDVLTYENKGIIFCVECDRKSGAALGYFISDGGSLIGREITLRINGKKNTSCVISLLNDEING